MPDLSRMKKHVGILNTTGVRCVVVFRKVPSEEDHCLIVETDHLSDMYHDNVIEICNSKESQDSTDFHEILNRRTFGDGLNALQALHYKGFLRKVPVSQVTLLPFPNQKLPLEMLNAQLDGNIDEYAEKTKIEEQAVADQKRKDNPLDDTNSPDVIAKGLIIQAEMLELEASKKRTEALKIAPELFETAKSKTKLKAKTNSTETDDKRSRGRPKLTTAEKAERLAERKIKRRERDRVTSAQKKVEKANTLLEEAVNAKIVRDAARSDTKV